MAEAWTRRELTAHVEGLALHEEGEAFVIEIARFAKSLEDDDRALLEEVLLERAKREEGVGKAVRRRAEEPGWLRRTLGRAEERAAELARRRRR
jgi:hypothetical protein